LVEYALYFSNKQDAAKLNATIEGNLNNCKKEECEIDGVTINKSSFELNADACAISTANFCDEESTFCVDYSDADIMTCNCKGGFERPPSNPDRFRCIDVNECNHLGRCNKGRCRNLPGSYECLCSEGHYGIWPNCSSFCEVNPCQNGGTCDVKDNDIACGCKDGFSGDLCEVPVSPDTTDWKLIAICLGVASGILLILILVLIIITCGRKKNGTKTHGSDPQVRYGAVNARSASQDSVSGVYIGKADGGARSKGANNYADNAGMRMRKADDHEYIEMDDPPAGGRSGANSDNDRARLTSADRENANANVYDNPVGPTPDEDEDDYSDIEGTYL